MHCRRLTRRYVELMTGGSRLDRQLTRSSFNATWAKHHYVLKVRHGHRHKENQKPQSKETFYNLRMK
uniref:Uncharacterized protein n=1 Tax=Arundo donax TaxID=35708 RepID=A0A0A8YYI3_ARUDO